MPYPHEGQVRAWLENWGRWSPETFGRRQWADAVRTSAFHSAPIPVLGGEAADTQLAVQRLDREERRALIQYHFGRDTVARMARRRRVSLDTLERLLHRAHQRFYELRWEVVANAKQRGSKNRAEAEPLMVKRLSGVRR